MNIFGKLTNDGLEQSTDRLGGFQPLETDIYTGMIKNAYAGKSIGGAQNITFIVDIDGREYRETIYITDKEGKNYFFNKNDKTKKVPLPGFTVADDICLIATGDPLAQQTAEEKIVNIFDFEKKADVPTSAQVLTSLLNKKVSLGIVKRTVNKQEKKGDEYVAVAETRDENYIEKVFHPELKLTVAEARNGQEEAKFWTAWKERNAGQTRDKRTIKDGQAGSAAAPKSAPAQGQPARKSLFSK